MVEKEGFNQSWLDLCHVPFWTSCSSTPSCFVLGSNTTSRAEKQDGKTTEALAKLNRIRHGSVSLHRSYPYMVALLPFRFNCTQIDPFSPRVSIHQDENSFWQGFVAYHDPIVEAKHIQFERPTVPALFVWWFEFLEIVFEQF